MNYIDNYSTKYIQKASRWLEGFSDFSLLEDSDFLQASSHFLKEQGGFFLSLKPENVQKTAALLKVIGRARFARDVAKVMGEIDRSNPGKSFAPVTQNTQNSLSSLFQETLKISPKALKIAALNPVELVRMEEMGNRIRAEHLLLVESFNWVLSDSMRRAKLDGSKIAPLTSRIFKEMRNIYSDLHRSDLEERLKGAFSDLEEDLQALLVSAIQSGIGLFKGGFEIAETKPRLILDLFERYDSFHALKEIKSILSIQLELLKIQEINPEKVKQIVEAIRLNRNIPPDLHVSLMKLSYILQGVGNPSSFLFSHLSENERNLVQYSERIKEKGNEAFASFLIEELKTDKVIESPEVSPIMFESISKINRNSLSPQFEKDAHRSNSMVLKNGTESFTISSGEKSPEEIKQQILDHLKKMAGEDPDLFLILQEALSQNLERIGTDQALRGLFKKELEGVNLLNAIPVKWEKKEVRLEEKEWGFEVFYQYNVSLLRGETFDPVGRIEISYQIFRKRGEKGDVQWDFSQPIRYYLGSSDRRGGNPSL